MLKSLAVGLLTLGAACATTAFAHDNHQDGVGRHFHDQHNWQRWCEHHKGCDKRDDQQDQVNTDPKPTAAPEIDPANALGALTLLAGGLAVIRGRRRSGAA